MTKPDDPLRASDGYAVASIPHRDAITLCRDWHYSRTGPNTGTYTHGLIASGEKIVGAALWIPPTQGAARTVAGDDWRGVLALSRLVVMPEMPTNAASFLLGRSMALIDRTRWPWLVTYADTAQGHTGAVYRATNWHEVGPVPAGDTWRHAETGEMRGRKRGGRTLLRAEMLALGFVPLPPHPKIKFTHTARDRDQRSFRRWAEGYVPGSWKRSRALPTQASDSPEKTT